MIVFAPQIQGGQKPHSKYLAEYFAFLYEFAKLGEEECLFLLNVEAIATMVNFYTGHKLQENYVSLPVLNLFVGNLHNALHEL